VAFGALDEIRQRRLAEVERNVEEVVAALLAIVCESVVSVKQETYIG
jgi:hypothetical protein